MIRRIANDKRLQKHLDDHVGAEFETSRAYMNRGEWLILGTTYQIMQRRKRRARRERDTFFTTLPTHGVSAAATLSHKDQREVIHVPIDSGPFCVDQNWLYFGTAVSR